MNKLLVLLFAGLTGCATVTTPVKHQLADAPVVLTERCSYLKQVSDKEERLSEFLKVITENYSLYYECATKHELLVKWYTEQKQLHDVLFNRK